MEFCSVSVRLGGRPDHVVANKVVSVPEIKLLQYIHGEDAVTDIIPTENRNVTSADERERLKQAYEPAQVEEQRNIVARVFGPMGPLPQRLIDIGIDPQAQAAEMRAKANLLVDAAAKMEREDEQGPAAADDEVDFGDDPTLNFEDEPKKD